MKFIKGLFAIGVTILMVGVGVNLSSCGSDLFIDPAGTCVTCTYAATSTTPARSLKATADGEGNITVTEAGQADITSERSILDFRLPHEASGAVCQ